MDALCQHCFLHYLPSLPYVHGSRSRTTSTFNARKNQPNMLRSREYYLNQSSNYIFIPFYFQVFIEPNRRHIQRILSFIVALTSSIYIIRDIFLICRERLNFFKNVLNFYSLGVFATAISYASMSLLHVADHRFVELGAIAIFLAWSYFIIHLMR